MFVGKNTFKEILDDENYVNWMSIEDISENRCYVNVSGKEKITINESFQNIVELIKSTITTYLLPLGLNLEIEYEDTLLVLNKDQVLKVTDEEILFKDNTNLKNPCEEKSIFIELYQLF